MPKVNVEVAHSLGREEAVRRLRKQEAALLADPSTPAKDVVTDWKESSMTFSMKVMGASISGSMDVEDAAVHTLVQLPLMAIAFKGMIESRLRGELEKILA